MNDNPLVSIVIPMYNQQRHLNACIRSLCRQTYSNLQLIIVDDGSSDNARQLVEGWMAEGKIAIRYVYQDNQGMHGAHNTAYRNITTELNTCIDSDDYMPDDAVEKILACWREHGNDKLAGIIGLDATEDGKVIGTRFPDGMVTTTLQGFYRAGGRGDKKLVYRTDVIKRYPEYPLFEGERYVGLAYKYMLIDQDYVLRTLNEPLVIVEYQPDGSSFNMYKQYWRNPRGFAFFRKAEMSVPQPFKRLLQVCAHYVSSSIISKNWRFVAESPKKLLTVLCIPSGIALYLLIRHKVKHDAKMNISKKG